MISFTKEQEKILFSIAKTIVNGVYKGIASKTLVESFVVNYNLNEEQKSWFNWFGKKNDDDDDDDESVDIDELYKIVKQSTFQGIQNASKQIEKNILSNVGKSPKMMSFAQAYILLKNYIIKEIINNLSRENAYKNIDFRIYDTDNIRSILDKIECKPTNDVNLINNHFGRPQSQINNLKNILNLIIYAVINSHNQMKKDYNNDDTTKEELKVLSKIANRQQSEIANKMVDLAKNPYDRFKRKVREFDKDSTKYDLLELKKINFIGNRILVSVLGFPKIEQIINYIKTNPSALPQIKNNIIKKMKTLNKEQIIAVIKSLQAMVNKLKESSAKNQDITWGISIAVLSALANATAFVAIPVFGTTYGLAGLLGSMWTLAQGIDQTVNKFRQILQVNKFEKFIKSDIDGIINLVNQKKEEEEEEKREMVLIKPTFEKKLITEGFAGFGLFFKNLN